MISRVTWDLPFETALAFPGGRIWASNTGEPPHRPLEPAPKNRDKAIPHPYRRRAEQTTYGEHLVLYHSTGDAPCLFPESLGVARIHTHRSGGPSQDPPPM